MGIFYSKPAQQDGQAIWVDDHASKHCQVCHTPFSFFWRRHHCRQCGALVCYDCGRYRAWAHGYASPQRVCEKCATLLAQEEEERRQRFAGASTLESSSSEADQSVGSPSHSRASSSSVDQPAPDHDVMERAPAPPPKLHVSEDEEEQVHHKKQDSIASDSSGRHQQTTSVDSTASTITFSTATTPTVYNHFHNDSQFSMSSIASNAFTNTHASSPSSSEQARSRPSSRPSSRSSSPRSSVLAANGGRRKSISGLPVFQPQETVSAVDSASSSSGVNSTPAGVESLSSLCLFNRLGGFGSLLVLDLRSADAYRKAHVPRSLSLPMTADDITVLDNNTAPSTLLASLEQRLHITDQRSFKMRQRCTVVLIGESVSHPAPEDDRKEDFALTPALSSTHSPVCIYLHHLLTLEAKIANCSILTHGFDDFYRLYPFMTCGYAGRELQTGKHIHRKPFPGYASIITSFIILGSKVDSANKEHLNHLNTTHILNCTKDIPNQFEDEKLYTYKRIDVHDEVTVSISERFQEAFEFIDSVCSCNGRVLVHCAEGISRSPTIVIAYLMKTFQLSLFQAYTYTKGQRKQVFSNLGFWKQLAAYEQELWRQRHGDEKDAPPFESTLDQCIDLALLTAEYRARKEANQADGSSSTDSSPSSTLTSPMPPNASPTMWALRGVAKGDAHLRAEEAIVTEAMTPIGPIVTAE